MTFPLPIRTAGDTAAEHVDDHNEIHGILGGGLPTGLTTAGTGHLANHNTIHTILNATEGQSLPTGIVAGATGHLSHHNTIHTLLNETPAVVYGPQGTGTLAERVQAVRDGTAPLAVTHPGGSPTIVNPGDSIASKITAAGAGGTLWFTKGTHTNTANRQPLAGQTWVLESAAGYTRTASDSAIIDGADANFTGHVVNFSSVADVTIRGGVWQRQGNASTTETWATAILNSNSGGNWTIEDAIIKNNYNSGLAFQNDGCTARRCYVTNNGRWGLNAATSPTNLLVEKCRVSLNNTRGIDPGASPEGGGAGKFSSNCDGLIVHSCWYHDNTGFGIWTDSLQATNVLYENNVSEHNIYAGLFFENVQGGCEMSHNYVYNNGYDTTSIGTTPHAFENKSQIRITGANSTLGSGVRGSVSRNVLDYDLTQDTARGGLFLIWDHTSSLPDTKNWDISENQFWLRTTTTRRIRGQDTDVAAPNIWDGDIDFFDNDYHVASTSPSYWQWDSGTGTGTAKNYTQWQAYHPGEGAALTVI